MIPTVSMLKPAEVSTSTANVRIAPVANRKMLKPIPPSRLVGHYGSVFRADIGSDVLL
jgi:hypothetical protein